MLKIGFWSKESGNLLSHSTGLTAEQVTFLKQLKPGDRLILWLNTNEDSRTANYTLKVFKSKKED
jgi:hypothetical protein